MRDCSLMNSESSRVLHLRRFQYMAILFFIWTTPFHINNNHVEAERTRNG